MPSLESRPYFVAPQDSVIEVLSLVAPDCAIEELSSNWDAGDNLIVRATVALESNFWEQTRLHPSENLTAILAASCPTSRSMMREHQPITVGADGRHCSLLEIDLTDSGFGVEVELQLSIVGRARTLDPSGGGLHLGAYLWQSTAPVRLELEPSTPGFPTSAISFSINNRRRVPWVIETVSSAEPQSSVSSSIRVYINSDLPLASALADGSADPALYSSLQVDIHLATFEQLAGFRLSTSVAEMEAAGEDDPSSLAALGLRFAGALGVSLEEALRLVREDVGTLIARSREHFSFGD